MVWHIYLLTKPERDLFTVIKDFGFNKILRVGCCIIPMDLISAFKFSKVIGQLLLS